MHRFAKNFLAGLTVLSQALILLILVFFHGNNEETDSLFLALSVLAIAQLVILMPFDQFVVYFNKIKVSSGFGYAIGFYIKSLYISIFTGVGVAVSLFLYFDGVGGSVFTSTGVINGFLYALPANAIIALNDRFLNAVGAILKSYLLVIIPNLSLLAGIIVWTFLDKSNIEVVGIVYSVLMAFGAALSTIYIVLSNLGVCLYCSYDMKGFIKKSSFMRLGHNLHTISFQIIVNYILLGFYDGALSLFNYAYRSVIALFTVSVGPSNRVYMYRLAIESAKNRTLDYSELALGYLKESSLIYFSLLSVLLLAVFVFYRFDFIELFDGFYFDISGYLNLLLIIGLWQGLVIVESVYVGVLITHNKAFLFIVANIMFAVVFVLLGFVTSGFYSVVLFSICGFFSQVISFFVYRFFLKNKLSIEVGL